MYQQQLLHTRFFFFVVSIFCLLQQQSAFYLFLVNNNNNSLYFSLPLYPFFVSKSEDKKGSRDCACCSEEFANSLPANISSFRPSVAEKWEPRLNSFCPLSNTSCEPSETNTNLFKMLSRREIIWQGIRLIRTAHLQHSTLAFWRRDYFFLF